VTALLALALLASPSDTLVVGVLADPVSLDPHRATDYASAAVLSNVCETLVRLRPASSRPEPALATTWATADGRTWTFTLREGVRFHDGAPFDADAVVANIGSLQRVRGFPGHAERVGPYVVSITLDKPNAAFLATLSQPFYCLESPRQLGGNAPPAGTGPYRFLASRPGAIELAPNADYWGGTPRLKGLVFKRFLRQDALIASVLASEVDVTAAVDEEGFLRLKERDDIALETQTGLNIAFLSLNNERTPFSDRRVRQAVARAIDRDALVRGTLAGHGEPARNPLPPSLWGYGTRTKELILDRPAASRLLASAGLAGGFETTLLAVDSPRPYMPSPLRIANQIRDDLGKVGIRAKIREAPSWAEYASQGSRGDYDMAVLGWQADTTDPNDFLSVLLGSEFIGTTNRSRYRSSEMDGLLKRGRMAADAEERREIYREVQELFQRDMPWVPLYHVAVFTAYRKAVHGLSIDPTGLLRFDKAWKAE
jgi:peptide/nickel transport system substrate-binding protein